MFLRKAKADSLLENIDVLSESPSRPVYQFAEDVDVVIMKLKRIYPKKRSAEEKKFIKFIQGRMYPDKSSRGGLTAVVPPANEDISLFGKHVSLKVWREWFDDVPKHN